MNSIYAQVDSLKLKNGDVIVGELKSMDRGILTIETDYSDSDFKIEWDQVTFLKTESKYMISLSQAKMSLLGKTDTLPDRISSTLTSDPNDYQSIIIQTNKGPVSIDINRIVHLKSFDSTFISRLAASVDIGFNLTKANNLKQINVRSFLGYTADKWGLTASVDITDSHQDSIADVHRLDAIIGFDYFLPKKFYLALSNSYTENDELNLDLRATVKAGLGYFLMRTNQFYWKVEGGAAANNENYFATIETEAVNKESAEAYIGTELNLFDIGDLNIMTSILTYPGITEKGRFRYDFKFDVKYDLPYDLYIKAGTTINFDNQPQVAGNEYDYVINTGIGWEL